MDPHTQGRGRPHRRPTGARSTSISRWPDAAALRLADVTAGRTAYGRLVIEDPDLAEAVAGRPQWQPVSASAAVYTAPDSPVSVRVERIHQPAKPSVRYMASVIRDGRASYTYPCYTANRRENGPVGRAGPWLTPPLP